MSFLEKLFIILVLLIISVSLIFVLLGEEKADAAFRQIQSLFALYVCADIATHSTDRMAKVVALLLIPVVVPSVTHFFFQITKSGIEVVKKRLGRKAKEASEESAQPPELQA